MRAVSRLLISVLLMGLLAVGAAALGWQSSAPLWAAGGEIRVVEARQQVNYPSGVALTVTIEADAVIDQVRVYYRPAGLRRWGYAYADFEPGRRVTATQSIPVREATYIAPGADVEYYFEIRDADGNILRTETAVVEYLDQRFDWKRVGIGPLQLLYHDIGDSRIEKAANLIREDLRRVEELLGLEEYKGFKGVIYNSHADATAAFPVQSQTTTDHGTFAGYAFGEQGVFLGTGLDRRVIVHESAHMMMREALDGKSVDMPAWLNEGFATYTEPEVRIRSSADLYRRTPRLKAMRSVSGTPNTIPLFYHKSVSVVSHLIEEYGEEKFRHLIKEISRGRDTEVALVKVYGFDEHGLDSSWAGLPIPDPLLQLADPAAGAESVPSSTEAESGHDTGSAEREREGTATQAGSEGDTAREDQQSNQSSAQSTSSSQEREQTRPQRSPQREGPSPFLFFDAWILAGVAILAVAVLSAKYVYRWLKPQSDAPENEWKKWQSRDRDLE